MRREGVLIVMRGEYVGGPVGSWQAMYTQWNKVTNKLYRYSNWEKLERDLEQLFELDHKELEAVPPALAGAMGSVHIQATPKSLKSNGQ
jgi:hypothetical protein